MIFVSKSEPLKLPRELIFYETNLILSLRVFTFLLVLYGLIFEFNDIKNSASVASGFSRGVEIAIGAALLFVYCLFLFHLSRR